MDKAKFSSDAKHLVDRFEELDSIQKEIDAEVQYSWQWYDKINKYNELMDTICSEYEGLLEFYDGESLQHTFKPQEEVDAFIEDMTTKADVENHD